MTLRKAATFKGMRVAGVLAAALVLIAAAVAMASANRAKLQTEQGKLGAMLAGGNGRTLYMFMVDKNEKSSCYGACAVAWPPDYTSAKPTVVQGSGVYSFLVGTTRRRSGALQATYNGHPLYFFSGDSAPGEMHGENVNAFGGHWYVVGPGGRAKKPIVFNPGAY